MSQQGMGVCVATTCRQSWQDQLQILQTLRIGTGKGLYGPGPGAGDWARL